MSRNLPAYHSCTRHPHSWPESIAVDKAGTLYFTDVWEERLYRIKRNVDGTLRAHEELLIEGLKKAGGVSICQARDVLYVGAGGATSGGRIIRMPLGLFEAAAGRPRAYETLKTWADRKHLRVTEFDIPTRPNGVVFDRPPHAVYYTYERLGLSSLVKKKGHIGKRPLDSNQRPLIIAEIFSPNGIDIDPTEEETTLVVSITLENAIKRIFLADGHVKAMETVSLGRPKGRPFGYLPDGLLCLGGGDLLVAAFGSGDILYLARVRNTYRGPAKIAEGLGNPTDLALGPSSTAEGRSLYVTTKQGGLIALKSVARGQVVEIPDIDTRIAQARQAVAQAS